MIWAPHIRVDGNTTTDDQGNTEQYDAWNRLVTVKSGTLTLMTYTYDGTGRRITEQSGSAVYPTNIYYSSGWQDIMETIGAAGVTSQAQYIWSPVYTNALILRDYDFTADGTFTLSERGYALQDANYNVTAVVSQHTINGDYDEDGDVDIGDLNQITAHWQAHLSGGDAVGDFDHDGQITIQDLNSVTSHSGSTGNAATWVIGLRMVYDPYGNFTTYNGGYTVNPNYLAWNITFQGGREDLNLKTIDSRNRIYDVTMARTFQEDPLGYVDGLNFHVWEEDNPINRVDPSGLSMTYPYKALPGAKFSGTIETNTPGSHLNPKTALATIHFTPPANTKSCTEIKIIQILVYEVKWVDFGLPSSDSWVVDNENGSSPFYPHETNWWGSSDPDATDVTFSDQPGATIDPRVVGELQEFRDYAVATEGDDKGRSYGYFEWGHEWSDGYLDFSGGTNRVWMGHQLPILTNYSVDGPPRITGFSDPEDKGVYQSALKVTAGAQSPIPGGLIVWPSSSGGEWEAAPI